MALGTAVLVSWTAKCPSASITPSTRLLNDSQTSVPPGVLAAPELAGEHHGAGLELVDELEVVLRPHAELGDQRIVHRPGDRVTVLRRFAAGH